MAPGIVCRAQMDTDVVVSGDGFSPVAIDIPDAPKVALPDVELRLSLDLDGGDQVVPETVVFSGF